MVRHTVDVRTSRRVDNSAGRFLIGPGLGVAGLLCVLAVSLAGTLHAQYPQPYVPAAAPGGIRQAQEVAPPPRPLPPGPPEGPSLLPNGVPGFSPGQVRLPRLGPGMQPLGCTPQPTPRLLQDYEQYVKQVVMPENTLDLFIGRSHLLVLEGPPRRVQISDESVAGYTVISPNELSMLGRHVGSTVLTLWFPDRADPNRLRVLSYLVRVFPDPEAKERLERVLKGLEAEINRIFPESRVCLTYAGDKLVVSGQAKDATEASNIIRVVRANVPGGQGGGTPAERAALIPTGRLSNGQTVAEVPPTPATLDYLTAGGPNIINLLRVPGEQQVMLQVTVAEVDRAAARSIGLNFNLFNNNGLRYLASTVGNVGQLAAGFGGFAPFGGPFGGGFGGGFGGNRVSPFNNLPVALDNGQIQLAIAALRELKYARTLAEPNLVTMNGQTANFQAGGLFPIPYVTGYTNFGLQGVSYLPVGVQLNFTPIILDRDRIRLTIAADVSDRDPTQGPTFINGTAIPNLVTRNFQTTVELREGQTLAVAGLLQNRLGAQASRVPFFGDLPFIGRLAAFDRTDASETELVILITPELVHPMDPAQVTALPGSDLFEPNDLEFYLHGRLESHCAADWRSPIRTDLKRQLYWRTAENLYVAGPHGYGGPDGSGEVPVPHAPPEPPPSAAPLGPPNFGPAPPPGITPAAPAPAPLMTPLGGVTTPPVTQPVQYQQYQQYQPPWQLPNNQPNAFDTQPYNQFQMYQQSQPPPMNPQNAFMR